MELRFIYEQPHWPSFRWDTQRLGPLLAEAHSRREEILTALRKLGLRSRNATTMDTLVQDVVTSNAIEGDHLDEQAVRSSVARRLGIDISGLPIPSREIDGVVEMSLDATQNFAVGLDDTRLFRWHSQLFPVSDPSLRVGSYRDDRKGPMQVVSGPIGRERVHFQAPPAEKIGLEMGLFLSWYGEPSCDPLLKAALAHFWFVTIHPFDDGNGRIGRAIMDHALAIADGDSLRGYSMTAQIEKNRKSYYEILERTQRSDLDVTDWLEWFLLRLIDAFAAAERVLEVVRRRQAFWEVHSDAGLNNRQARIIDLLIEGFQGKLQSAKYAKLMKCSTDTALRDLNDLVSRGILIRDEAGGRSTHYRLVDG